MKYNHKGHISDHYVSLATASRLYGARKDIGKWATEEKMFPGAVASLPILFCQFAECKAASFEINVFSIILIGGWQMLRSSC